MSPSFFTVLIHRSKIVFSAACLLFLAACTNGDTVAKKEMVATPEEINQKAEDLIRQTLESVLQNPSGLPDSIKIKNADLVQRLYADNNFTLLWSSEGVFKGEADSLLRLIDSGVLYGLFPKDYYREQLTRYRSELVDTSGQNGLDAAKWAYNDMLSTSAFIQLVKDIRLGRLVADSVLVKDTSLTPAYYVSQYQKFSGASVFGFASSLEPEHRDYHALKAALRGFLSEADMRNFTTVRSKDSAELRRLLYKRLTEEDSLSLAADERPDSLTLAAAIKQYQKLKRLKEDGKLSSALINRLNNTDREKWVRIAITMDKYKMLPAMPETYIWVNLPSYYLQVWEDDSLALTSKIIIGKTVTHTPQLTSNVTDMITYPQWTIPASIIKKEILPGLKRNPGYTQKRGYSLVDSEGNEVSPYEVDWNKYKTGIPYKVVQGSGDANALGVMKFNFANPYSVYLHDTNQRYLFDKSGRALSHGCVRVQKWKALSEFILRRDSAVAFKRATPIDSLNSWLAAKMKKVIPVRQKLPLFIRYFSCEGKDGKLVVHDDVYEEDKRLRDLYFAAK